MGVDKAMEQKADSGDPYDEVGAGDQGMMFGYACDETDALMPMPIWLAHRMAERLAQVRKEKLVDFLRPDGKTQVSVEYEDGVPVRLDTVLISTQHGPGVNIERDLKPALIEHVIRPSLPAQFADDDFQIFVNPTGQFELGGPHADSGLTGRKIIVDTYGGMARHGGGAFSGKDPTKVDRSAAYAVRQIAKAVVAAGLAQRCEAQVAYAIGVAHPMSIMVDTFGTSEIAPDKIEAMVRDVFDMRPAAIMERLNLRRPIYQRTAAYGHFGRTDGEGFTWEQVEPYVTELRRAAARRRPYTALGARAPNLSSCTRRHGGRARLRLRGPGRARVADPGRHDRARPAARAPRARVGRGRRRGARHPRTVARRARGRVRRSAARRRRPRRLDRLALGRPPHRGAAFRVRPQPRRPHPDPSPTGVAQSARQTPQPRRFGGFRWCGGRRWRIGARSSRRCARRRARRWSRWPTGRGRGRSPSTSAAAGREVASVHSDESDAARTAAWRRAARGGCVVVGGRSAALAPVPDLAAAIVVDDADEALQEERSPTWHARDVLYERAARAERVVGGRVARADGRGAGARAASTSTRSHPMSKRGVGRAHSSSTGARNRPVPDCSPSRWPTRCATRVVRRCACSTGAAASGCSPARRVMRCCAGTERPSGR